VSGQLCDGPVGFLCNELPKCGLVVSVETQSPPATMGQRGDVISFSARSEPTPHCCDANTHQLGDDLVRLAVINQSHDAFS
jgi:hypothetical protein